MRYFLTLLGLVFLAGSAEAQLAADEVNKVPHCVVSQLPSCYGGLEAGRQAWVVDGSDADDCSAGGGTDKHICVLQPDQSSVASGTGSAPTVGMTDTPQANYIPVFDNGALPANITNSGCKYGGTDLNIHECDASTDVSVGGIEIKEGSDNGTNEVTVRGPVDGILSATKAWLLDQWGVFPAAITGSELKSLSTNTNADTETTIGGNGTYRMLRTHSLNQGAITDDWYDNSGYFTQVQDGTTDCTGANNCRYAGFVYDPADNATRDLHCRGEVYSFSDTATALTDVEISLAIWAEPTNPESDNITPIASPIVGTNADLTACTTCTPSDTPATNAAAGFTGWQKFFGPKFTIDDGEVIGYLAKQITGDNDDVNIMYTLGCRELN